MRAALRIALVALMLPQTSGTQAVRTVAGSPTLEVAPKHDALGRVLTTFRFGDSTLAVVDQSSMRVRYFDTKGREASSVGARGSGPGEFRTILFVGACAPGEISLFDQALNRVTTFDAAGRRLSILPARPLGPVGYYPGNAPSPYALACGATGLRLLVGWPESAGPPREGPHRAPVGIAFADGGGTYRRLGTFAGPERFRYRSSDGPRFFGRKTVVAVGLSRLFVGTADSMMIEVFDRNGTLIERLRERSQRRPLTERDRRAWAAQLERRFLGQFSRTQVQATLSQASLPEDLPAYDRFIAVGDTLWVEDAVAPSDSVRRWTVFKPGVGAVGRVTVPSCLEIHQVLGDEVIGKWIAVDGSEHVRVYRLIDPPTAAGQRAIRRASIQRERLEDICHVD